MALEREVPSENLSLIHISMDYRVRGFTRDVNGKKLFLDHPVTSIQDYINPEILRRYDAVDINVYAASLFPVSYTHLRPVKGFSSATGPVIQKDKVRGAFFSFCKIFRGPDGKGTDQRNCNLFFQFFQIALGLSLIHISMKIPDWGPPIDDLNMDQIVTYVRPNTKMSAKWSDVPEDIDVYKRQLWSIRRNRSTQTSPSVYLVTL